MPVHKASIPVSNCTATSKRTGQQCGRTATPGTNVCSVHGANAKQVKKKAHEVVRRQLLTDKLGRWSVPVITTPEDALLDTLYAVSGRVAWLKHRIDQFKPGQGMVVEVDDLNNDTASVDDGDDNPALLFIEREQTEYGMRIKVLINPLLVMLRSEERHLVMIARECQKAGIEQTRIDLHATLADMLVGILGRALPEFGVTATPKRVIDVIAHAMLTA